MTNAAAPIDRWEYTILLADMSPGGMDKLNAAGREGWEAVTGTSGGNRMIVLLKRRLTDANNLFEGRRE